jgi:two-component system chemotaxis response regulator CheY
MSGLNHLDRNMPILIVDDFSTMRRIIKNCLKGLGFENITEADDGQNAWDKMQTADFKFIVSDWNMPNMMGVDLLRTVRASEKHKEIPFMMVTAETQKDNLLEATKAGASNFIIKPFTADILQTKMEAIFKKTP